MQKKTTLRKFIYFGCACVILLFLVLNIYTPLIADDYSYSLGINSIGDIFLSQYSHYFNWGGRSISLFLAQFWLFVGKSFFNIANTVVYCLFILLVQFHITGTLKKVNPFYFLLINVFFWFFVPVWGQNFLWLTGSCVYLWSAVFILFFLVPFRKKHEIQEYKLSALKSVLFFFAGIFAGWSNENSGAAVLFFLLAYFLAKFIRKEKYTLFEITGTAGFLIGFIILLTAPGNYVRADVMRQLDDNIINTPLLFTMFKRFISITVILFKNNGLLLMAISIFFSFDLIYHKKQKINLFSAFYFLSAVSGAYSMIMAPGFPDRAFMIVIVFLLITLGNILIQMKIQLPEIIKRNSFIFIIIGLVIMSVSFIDTSRRILGVYLRWYDRLELILTEKENGVFDIEVNPIYATDRRVALYLLDDLMPEEEKWPNKDIAQYYGLRSIKIRESEMYPLWDNKSKRIRQVIVPPKKIIKKIIEL